MAEPTIETASAWCDEIVSRIGEAVVVEQSFLEHVLTAFLARGHVLLEDVPGTGKTLTGLMFAQALDLEFSRIQFTPDLLPSDITGSHVFNRETGQFRFTNGPIFANVVLADEINRAPPKTQAALLEAMDEGQVTVDGETRQLPEPFFVIATQNPIEQEGTFALPEAQRDRFMLKLSIGYPDLAGELELVDRRSARERKLPAVDAVLGPGDIEQLIQMPELVSMDDSVRRYMVELARATRTDDRVEIGVSPRAIQRYYEAARAVAVIRGRDFVVPDDVKRIARPLMQHRIVRTTEAELDGVTGADVIDRAASTIEVPNVDPDV